MNELQLSNGLVSIATKINSHKNNIGYSFIEIGKELIRAKEEDIKHGEWQLFLDEINMSRTQAQRHITVTEQYKMGKLPDVGTIGLNAMYEIATLSEERRQDAINEDGTAKSVREIQSLKQEVKKAEQAKQQAESQAETERKERERLERENEELANVEPERIEVVPDDYDFYKGNYESAVSLQKRYKEQMEEMSEELNTVHDELKKERYKITDDEAEEKEKQVKIMMLDASKSVLQTKIDIDEFMQKVAVTSYRRGAIAASSENAKKKIREGIDDLKNFISEMEMALDGTIEQDY